MGHNKRLLILIKAVLLVSYVICTPVEHSTEITAKDAIQATTDLVESKSIFDDDTIEAIPNSAESGFPKSNSEELDDMEHGGSFENRAVVDDSAPIDVPQPIIAEPLPNELRSETEWIEESNVDALDVDLPRAEPVSHVTLHRGWPWIVAMTALLTAIMLVIAIAIISYKYLTMRYNHRQILINEEDMIDPNDMKHFTL